MLSEGGITAAHKGGGDAEVGDLYVAAVRNEDVAELDVTVDEACGMGGAERSGDIGSDLSGAVGMQWSGGAQDIGHRSARHMLHHDVVGAPLLPPVIDANDVWMVEVCGSLGFTTEALNKVRIVCELGEQHLERDLAAEQAVTCEVDVGHPASGDMAQQFVSAVEDGRALLGHSCVAYRCMTNARMHGPDRNDIARLSVVRYSDKDPKIDGGFSARPFAGLDDQGDVVG